MLLAIREFERPTPFDYDAVLCVRVAMLCDGSSRPDLEHDHHCVFVKGEDSSFDSRHYVMPVGISFFPELQGDSIRDLDS